MFELQTGNAVRKLFIRNMQAEGRSAQLEPVEFLQKRLKVRHLASLVAEKFGRAFSNHIALANYEIWDQPKR